MYDDIRKNKIKTGLIVSLFLAMIFVIVYTICYIRGVDTYYAVFITMIFSYVFNSNNAITDALGKAYMTFLQYWLPSTLGSVLSAIGMSSDLNYAASIIVNIGYIVAFGAFAVLISYKKEIK